MLSPSQLAHIEVVLVSPRNPLNIGAAARAMANFGVSHLTAVAPYEPHWQETLSAVKSAVGAEEILQDARKTGSLAEAIADCTLVIGTGTLTYRKPEQPVILLPNLASYIESEGTLCAGRAHSKIALVFGPEKHGLTREDLSHCHVLVEIPTSPAQPSMNLGQAVAVCLYELTTRPSCLEEGPTTLVPSFPPFPRTTRRRFFDSAALRSEERMGHGASVDSPAMASGATAGRQELLAGLVEELMVVSEYSPAAMRESNRHDLRLLLRRLTLSDNDARRILGLLRRVLYRLKH